MCKRRYFKHWSLAFQGLIRVEEESLAKVVVCACRIAVCIEFKGSLPSDLFVGATSVESHPQLRGCLYRVCGASRCLGGALVSSFCDHFIRQCVCFW